ncbi:MAG TPA: iron-containing alcohol dehydrogenase family protein [Flavobacteriales bacterium]|nr:iron-containing alcohol dehydrogenase family protein [Flavobacteriales bacterium]HMR27136.1 iron-containing alcohol dehydrogenase family protein [Flavobacteriales bacterium]
MKHMQLFRNFKSVTKTCYGRGSFGKLGEILEPQRSANDGFMVFVVDDYFEHKADFVARIPELEGDEIHFISALKEPTTELIDKLRDDILKRRGLPAGIVGIGGGSMMDIAKAASLMFTNEGSSVQYQGLNLIKNPGIYHCGVPTISGTGAEVSMTAVLTGPVKKLGLKCDWTVFDQIVLDPDLIASVPTDQWFYTGMDTYIHSVEAITGTKKNTFAEAYSEKSLEMCREVYMKLDRTDRKSDELLMVASYMGGLSLTYSEVGVCHALSYGLGKVLEMHHCFANCVAFNQLEDVYGEYVHEFKHMVKERGVNLPANLSKDWDEKTLDAMAEVAYNLPHMWDHAFGPDWQKVLDRERIKGWYRRM